MLEASSQTPDYLTSPTAPPAAPSPPQAPTPTKPKQFLSLVSDRPSLRVTSEFDSDSRVFFHKVSCKMFDDLAKLKLSFVNNVKREISEPLLALKSKYLSIHLKSKMPSSEPPSMWVLSCISKLPTMSRFTLFSAQ
ncbi:hypothetical protein GQ457_14G007380 [Hibiscus cannabinus]